jgi:hypothetical protein
MTTTNPLRQIEMPAGAVLVDDWQEPCDPFTVACRGVVPAG